MLPQSSSAVRHSICDQCFPVVVVVDDVVRAQQGPSCESRVAKGATSTLRGDSDAAAENLADYVTSFRIT